MDNNKIVPGYWRWLEGAGIALVVALLAGCATNPEYDDPRDPWEGFNRSMFEFNDGLDRAIFKPLAKGYKAITPEPVDKGITNFYANLSDVGSAINNLLQVKLQRAGTDVGRVVVNTTLGLLGFFDVATNLNLPRYHEDFGQTFGVWGAESGPYIVLPLFGPSTGRDAVGLVFDWLADPIRYVSTTDGLRFALLSIWFVDRRADLLGASRLVEQAALDPYQFVRDAYLQRRRYDIYDGNPPPEPYEDVLEFNPDLLGEEGGVDPEAPAEQGPGPAPVTQ
ncbi:MAG: VacJ family lipoprotein [Gammaproteobacteria bacterium]|nr:VacJ family lipoprotein [Gammaproteobacteria bacterium]